MKQAELQKAFEEMSEQSDRASGRQVAEFVRENLCSLKELRRAFQHTRSWDDEWYRELWSWIGQPEITILEKLESAADEFEPEDHQLDQAWKVLETRSYIAVVPHCERGPDWSALHLDDNLSHEIPGHQVTLAFEEVTSPFNSVMLTIAIEGDQRKLRKCAALEFCPPANSPVSRRPTLTSDLTTPEKVRFAIYQLFVRWKHDEPSRERIEQVLEAAYLHGLWESSDVSRLFRLWEAKHARGSRRRELRRHIHQFREALEASRYHGGAFSESVQAVRDLLGETTKHTVSPLPTYQWDWLELYDTFDFTDRQIVESWINDFCAGMDRGYAFGQMASARMAELAAKRFYSTGLCMAVTDVSSHAISRQSNDWMLYDLSLDDGKRIDVKNARTNFGNKNFYSRHCVPSFKRDREGRHIRIAGVFSPYLKSEEIEQRNTPFRERGNQVTYLGETSRDEIDALVKDFSDGRFRVQLTANRRGARGEVTIPHWVFNYPDKFYERRQKFVGQLSECLSGCFPSTTQVASDRSLPLIVISGVDIPPDWRADLKPWEPRFIELIRDKIGVSASLPRLLMCIVRHFSELCTSREGDGCFTPSDYARVLGCDIWPNMPLQILDPLGTVEHWLGALDVLWEHRGIAKLSNYDQFIFTGVGMLRGRNRSSGREETLVAYCGGKVNNGPCGYSPLVSGRERHCTEGYLICRKCGYCCLQCVGLTYRGVESEYDF